jgi:putative sterol carrier protein
MPYAYGTPEWDSAYKELVTERTSKQAPPYVVGTPEWVSGFEKAVQNDAAYKQIAKDWVYSVVMHLLADPQIGFNEDIYIFMDLMHGDCRSMRLVPAAAGEAGDFVITGGYDLWKSVMKKELEPISGIVQGKLKLKGDLPTIVREVKQATRLVELVGTVPSKFHGELGTDDIEAYRSSAAVLKAEFGI